MENGKWFHLINGMKGDELIPDQIIIRLANREKPNLSMLLEKNISGIKAIGGRYGDGFYIIHFLSKDKCFENAQKLKNSGLFDVVEFNAYGTRCAEPNDPYYDSQQLQTNLY